MLKKSHHLGLLGKPGGRDKAEKKKCRVSTNPTDPILAQSWIFFFFFFFFVTNLKKYQHRFVWEGELYRDAPSKYAKTHFCTFDQPKWAEKRAFSTSSEILNFENRTIIEGDTAKNVSEGKIQVVDLCPSWDLRTSACWAAGMP